MSASAVPTIRLRPMTEAQFREAFARAVRRHAEDGARRGVWTAEGALDAARWELGQFLPKGRATPGHHFRHVIGPDGGRVGEAWFTAQERGGKVRFWVDWLGIDPEHRRRGYGRAALRALEREAWRRGADRIGLFVWLDNPGALALYRELGYVARSQQMTKPLAAPARAGDVRSAGRRRSRAGDRSSSTGSRSGS